MDVNTALDPERGQVFDDRGNPRVKHTPRGTPEMIVRMTIEMPEGALSPATGCLRPRAAPGRRGQSYELRLVSRARAAEIAGVSRAAFLAALGRLGALAFQMIDLEDPR
jgi:hypothetical protein